MLLVSIFLIVLILVPIVPTYSIKEGKQKFDFIVETDNLNRRLDCHFDVPEIDSNNIEVKINEDMDTEELIVKSDDWVLYIEYEGANIWSTTSNVTYYDSSQTIEREEERMTAVFVEFSFTYYNKSTDILDTTKKTLISETTSGEFSYDDYIELAENKRIPLSSQHIFDQVELVNKETYGEEKEFTYDTEKEVYVQDIAAILSYEINYLVSEQTYTSILISESTSLKVALLGPSIAALVGSLFSQIKKRINLD